MRYLLSFFISLSAHAKDNRIVIAVIDTGVRLSVKIRPYLCHYGHYAIYPNHTALEDFNDHGTNVAGLIADRINPKTHCLQIISYCRIDCTENTDMTAITSGIYHAIANRASFINLSLEGPAPSLSERKAIDSALVLGIKVVVAAGNSYKNLDKKCDVYPACYDFDSTNFHVVGSSTHQRGYKPYSNYGKAVKYLEDGTQQGSPKMNGTSQATAIHTGKWASGEIK